MDLIAEKIKITLGSLNLRQCFRESRKAGLEPGIILDNDVAYYWKNLSLVENQKTKTEGQQQKAITAALIPKLIFSEKWNYVNCYNLALMSELVYSTRKDVIDYFEFLKNNKSTPIENWSPHMNIIRDSEAFQEYDLLDVATSSSRHNKYDNQFFFAKNDKTVLISVRGSEFPEDKETLERLWDWVGNLNATQVDSRIPGHGGQVHEGFMFGGQWVLDELFKNQLLQKDKEYIITGHSLGGAIATYVASALSHQGYKVMLYTYGAPRVATESFIQNTKEFPYFRHVNDEDIVPALPSTDMDLNKSKLIIMGPVMGTLMGAFKDQDKDNYQHFGELVIMKNQIEKAKTGAEFIKYKKEYALKQNRRAAMGKFNTYLMYKLLKEDIQAVKLKFLETRYGGECHKMKNYIKIISGYYKWDV